MTEEQTGNARRIVANTYVEALLDPSAGNWASRLHTFGVRQNTFNQNAERRIRELELDNRRLVSVLKKSLQQVDMLQQVIQEQKERQKLDEQRNREIFGRVAMELDRMQAELDRLRLTAQLNSNAIDRLYEEKSAEAVIESVEEMPIPLDMVEAADTVLAYPMREESTSSIKLISVTEAEEA